MKRPFLIVETGQPIDALRRFGSFGDWIRVAAGLPKGDVRHCWVAAGEKLPLSDEFTGILITGSGAMVSDREPWSERCADWLREAAEAGQNLFGICYGHQLLAHALGGNVDYNPRGREMGTVPVRLGQDAAVDPLFSGLPAEFHAHATHLQTVLEAPKAATVLASSDRDDCQAFRWKERVWGVQFHPEFSTQRMRDYIFARRHALSEEGHCHKHLSRTVKPAPLARRVLKRFVCYARQCR